MFGIGPSCPTSTYRYSSTAPNALAATRNAAIQAVRRGQSSTSRAAAIATPASNRNSPPCVKVAFTPSYAAAFWRWTVASIPSAAAVPTRRAHDAIGDRASGRGRTCTVAALTRLARSGVRTCHRRAGGAHHVPQGAKGVLALAVLLPGAAVAGEVVQRVLVVGDLGGAITTLDRAEQRGLDGAARLGGAAALVDRPGGHAGAAAGRLVGLVLLEQVQRPTLGIDQDRPELAAGGRDRRHTGLPAGGGGAATAVDPSPSPRARAAGARSAAAAPGRDRPHRRQRGERHQRAAHGHQPPGTVVGQRILRDEPEAHMHSPLICRPASLAPTMSWRAT